MADKREGPITLRVGKNGLTPQLVSEIRMLLEKHKTLKIKLLKSSLADIDRKEMASSIKEKSKARVVDMRGQVITLKK